MQFDLRDMCFLQMLGPHGPVDVGLIEAGVRAHELALAFSDQLEMSAVFRQLLLAGYIDAFGFPATNEEWWARWNRGRIDDQRWLDYWDRCGDRMQLFDETWPFGQVGGLTALSGNTKPVSVLELTVATGNNVTLFASSTEVDVDPLTPERAARLILTAQCWDTAAIKTGAVGDPRAKAGKTTGNPTAPTGQLGLVIPTGPTLFHTLLLNTPVQGPREAGAPPVPWRRDEPPTAEWTERDAFDLLDLLTFQSRRIRLFPEYRDDGSAVVTSALVCAGDRLRRTPDFEPHTVWRKVKNPKKGEPEFRPARHQAGRSLWRGLESLLAAGKDSNRSATALNDLPDRRLPAVFPLSVVAVGVEYGNQSAVVETVMVDSLPLPVEALRDAAGADDRQAVRELLINLATQAESVRRALNTLDDGLRVAAGGDPIPWDKGQRPGDQFMAVLDRIARRAVADLQREPDRFHEISDAWERSAYAAARAAATQLQLSAAPSGFEGRRLSLPGNKTRQVANPIAELIYLAKLRGIFPFAASEDAS